MVDEMNWIPVTERMPEEQESIFAKYKGTDKWQEKAGVGQAATISRLIRKFIDEVNGKPETL